METATLMAHTVPSMCPNSLKKTLNCSSFSLNSRNTSSFSLNLSLCSSRCTRKWRRWKCTDEFGTGQTSLKDSNGLNSRVLDRESSHAAAESVHLLDGCDGSYVSPFKSRSEHASRIDALDPHSNTAFCQLLKYSILFGSLTLHGSQQALAASDFTSGLQSVNFFGDLNDISTGFASAFLLIFFSELGDKTFFIAALLAARKSAAVVFTGTFGALATMTIISVILGRTFHYIDGVLPLRFGESDLPVDDIAAVCLLVYFGVTTLIDAASSDSQKAEEEQKEAELAVSELSGNGAGILAAANTVISTYLLVFVAEWGDKSFFSTIALAAASSPLGVIGGALAGHGVATLLAVLGGSLLGTFLSEKVIAYTGGGLFLIFAGITLIEIIRG
ncbi:Protein pam71, chloroplastic [Dionaea muscipula]